MFDLLKALFGTPQYVSRTDTTADSPDPDPNDIWLLTDPDARDEYAKRNELREFEHDIRFQVMRGGAWLTDELDYKREIRRLLRKGVLADKGSYWYVSPHPTVYRAMRDGALAVAGRTHRFRAGDDIVFQCRKVPRRQRECAAARTARHAGCERDKAEDDPGPVLVAHLQPTDKAMLCGEMQEAMTGMGGGKGGMGRTM